MKIPHNLAFQLMEESPSFRTYILDLAYPEFGWIKKQVLSVVSAASGKIDAIKKVTAIYEENPKAFLDAYPHAELVEWLGLKSLSLVWRKNLVESYRNFN